MYKNESDAKLIKGTIASIEKELEKSDKASTEFSKNMFSKPLYEDKPDKVLTPEELAKQSEEEKKQREIEEEAEYLETLSTFHWIVYPFFKTIETVCDKIFGCKRKLEA